MHSTKKRILAAALPLLALFFAFGLYNNLKLQRYTIDAEPIVTPLRIVLVADLHSCRYGDDEQELIDAVDAQQPDLLLLAGDIFDDVLPDNNTAAFLESVGTRYPCYYVTGNHEYWSGESAFQEKMAILDRCGVRRLSDEAITLTVNGETLNLCGVNDPDAGRLPSERAPAGFAAQLAQVKQLAQPGNYTVLLSHRPEAFEQYSALGFDLALCGHAHGGQWRIPFLLNGLYAPNQGLFPKYAGGEYHLEGTTMIVSRGLARESIRIPRFYDRPELVVIDLI